jgi:hypothetical protein
LIEYAKARVLCGRSFYPENEFRMTCGGIWFQLKTD